MQGNRNGMIPISRDRLISEFPKVRPVMSNNVCSTFIQFQERLPSFTVRSLVKSVDTADYQMFILLETCEFLL